MSSVVSSPVPNVPVLPLWPQGAPGTKGTADGDIPALSIYSPVAGKSTGGGVVICGGGGYDHIDYAKESIPAAMFLSGLGITAFVLRYRLTPTPYQYPVMMWDAQRAIRVLRQNAAQYGLKPDSIGIMGFSAGGHLASTIATHTDTNFDLPQLDAIDSLSARPDFQILIYPVITMTPPFTAHGTHTHLLGGHPDWEQLQDYLSNEKHVTLDTPPAFLVSTAADVVAPCENALSYFAAMRVANVPGELHIYERGAHGAGLAATDLSEGTWPGLLAQWLRERGLISAA
jgi:acetyl esterase/lipase